LVTVAGRPVLLVQHVEWEGPHRIGPALGDLPAVRLDPLEGEELPAASDVAGAIFMGGPMSVHDTDRFPALAAEVEWLSEALEQETPVLGICLGAELLARALGAEVRAAPVKELGWGPVEVTAADDPLVGALAPRTSVLHWHGEVFDAPPDATVLARSAATEVQAFRAGPYAWGLLFHAEADGALVERWLAEPSMGAEAREVLGKDFADRLREGAALAGEPLRLASSPGFGAFADLCRSRRDAAGGGGHAIASARREEPGATAARARPARIPRSPR
jgi:GMP synthase (glutamine-hydrolysing)